MGCQEYAAVIAVFLSLCVALLMAVMFDVRAQWKQREDMTKLLILALFRMSNRHVRAMEEQTRRLDALLEKAGAAPVRVDPAVVADAQRAAEDEAVHEATAALEALESMRTREGPPGAER